ncbi:unnamed protein product [Ostreobium quekettii]|uniref:Elongation factor-like 1 n=1 Tax=Ostreobium quekettii TaxID=121088 RepID=A0A8S1JHK6_9CHLO|nr:unnamed protein product [Ostreobium quekettii]|eukprot:evm.model.scf_814.7 EVM.evm.TU.scf_814.7   scf_814:44583-56849(+)
MLSLPMKQPRKPSERTSARVQGANAAEHRDEELELKEDTFSPSKGNVAFGSAIDGWAFRTDQFAEMYASKLGASAVSLRRALWGDYYFQSKTKSVVRRKAVAGRLQPMFVQFILEPLWNAYSVCDPGTDVLGLLSKIIKARRLSTVDERQVKSPDPRQALRAVLRAWLPISEAVLGMVVQHMPSPLSSARLRIPHLLSSGSSTLPLCEGLPKGVSRKMEAVTGALMASSADVDAPLVVYVSKMVATPIDQLPRSPGDCTPVSENGVVFLAFGRVFSGVARSGARVHVLTANYKPTSPGKNRQTVVLGDLYLMMGRCLERLQAVPAGNVLAIAGLEHAIVRSATVTSTPACQPLVPMTFQASPIVRVAVEPVLPPQMHQLAAGLALLSKADPSVEVQVLDSGEFILGSPGEVHLDTCLKELRERFAKIELEVSPPLVAFRESIFDASEVPEEAASQFVRIIDAKTPTGTCEIRVRAHPIPSRIASLLEEMSEVLRAILVSDKNVDVAEREKAMDVLHEAMKDVPKAFQSLMKRAWLLGPRRVGPNLLLCHSTAGPSLFDAPPSQVAHLDKSQKGGPQPSKPSRPLAESVRASEGSRKVLQGKNESEDGDVVDDDAKSARSIESTQVSKVAINIPFDVPDAAIRLGFTKATCDNSSATEEQLPTISQSVRSSVESGIVGGFLLASAAGPLCDEPMWGVALEIEARILAPSQEEGPGELDVGEEVYGPLSGQVINIVNMACRRAVVEAGPRLVEAMYLCEVQVTGSEPLAKVYAVLSRRRGTILRDELRGGSDVFIVHAYLPAEASFGFVDELRKKSRGGATASMMFSHWERLQADPFFFPTTEEEREEFGEDGLPLPNLARRLIDAVRRRKGLQVEQKVVEKATKQRTLAKKV